MVGSEQAAWVLRVLGVSVPAGGGAAPAGAPAATDAQGGMEAFSARARRLAGQLKPALELGKAGGDAQRKAMAQALALAKGGDFVAAAVLLDGAEAWLAAKPAQGGLVALQKCRLDWDRFRTNVQSQLREIEANMIAAVRAHNSDTDAEFEFDEGAVAGNARMIYSIMDGLDTRLTTVLDKALNASDGERQAWQDKAAALVGEYRRTVAGNTLIDDIDRAGFIPTKIRAEADRTLAELARQL